MGKMIMLEGEPAFFIRFACGRIIEGIKWMNQIPSGVKWVAFCRRDVGPIRKYRIDRLDHLSKIESLASPIFSMNPKLEI
jgi:hypothetical protein